MLHPLRPDGFIEPCQPVDAAKPPSGAGWLHEIKLDGFRLMALRRGLGARLLTRNGNNTAVSTRAGTKRPLIIYQRD
jgi:bifunctional non-homologous end joining protein LigD